MENYGYEKPVSELLYLGREKLDSKDPHEWIDYIDTYGFTSEHTSELQRLYHDQQFKDTKFDDQPEWYAYIHVLHVLGQLHNIASLPFLLEIAETEQKNDWVLEDLPYVLSLYGADVFQPIKACFTRNSDSDFLSSTLLHALSIIATRDPEIRQDIFDYWMELLSNYETNDFSINTDIVCYFADHKYEPALPLMEKAFKAKRVDEFVSGDYIDILVEFGYVENDLDREKDYFGPSGELFKRMRESLEAIQNSHAEIDENADEDNNPFEMMDSSNATKRKISKSKKKSKRKQAKKSRKNNRKK